MYLICEAAECTKVRLRERDEDASSSVDTYHRAVSSVKMIQRIYITRQSYVAA